MWKLKIAEGNNDPWLVSVNDHIGRQHWEFDPKAGTPGERAEVERVRDEFKKNRFKVKRSSDLLTEMQLRKQNPRLTIPRANRVGIDEITEKEEEVNVTLSRAISYYSTMQACDGHWPSESDGPLFFLPTYVMALYITGDLNAILSPEHQKEIKRYMYNHQNEDAGWGFHIEGHSTMLSSALCYIALRLLGEGADDGEDNAMARGRQWILDHGGVTYIPSWGKFWLAVLGVYEWEGCNPISPEFWLLPKFSPLHPGKFLCNCRVVYMPMSYLYGKRYVGSINELIMSLRNELYCQSHNEINWNNARNLCAKEDLYYPHPFVQDMVWGFLHHFVEPILARWPFSKLREKALKTAMEHVHYEDINSRYLSTGCVEKVLCLIACWVEDPSSKAYKRHLARIPDYLWVAEDGMKMQNFGSQLWDVVFATQAILASGLTQEFAATLRKAHDFVKSTQVKENPSGNFTEMYRNSTKGAWPFSIQDQGWQVSDCTAEGLKVALLLSQMPAELVGEKIEATCMYDAVHVILSLQSKNGGFTAWEPEKGFRWLEKFNPTEFFKDIMTEREYVECTSSAIQSMVLFKTHYPKHRSYEIERCISRGLTYIEDNQNPDGSWYGSWGICFTYATWFAVDALAGCGRNYQNSHCLRKACDFLLSKQLLDGGWGESHLSCTNQVYTNLDGNRSNLVQTAWALLSLIKAGQGDVDCKPIERGIKLLINSQMEDGAFPQQEVTGVFFNNCILNYPSYRNTFPIWALGEYTHSSSRRSKDHMMIDY